jgi:hypothetical protein
MLVYEQNRNENNPLGEREIRLFKILNKKKVEYPNAKEFLEYIKRMMPFVNRPQSDARYVYFVFTSNYRPKGDYENITRSEFIDVPDLKAKKIPNNTAYDYTYGKIPFKGSNVEGGWETDNNGVMQYIVKSYTWYPIFLFKNNMWFQVSDNYSSTTSKHISYSDPSRYDSELRDNVYLVTKDEMKKLVNGTASFDDILKDRVKDFTTEKKPKDIINKPRWISFGWSDDRKKVNYTINKIGKYQGKVKIMVTINKAGTVEGNNKLIINPDGYEVPSEFSNDIEQGIKNRIISDNSDYLSDDNTIFVFNHNQ